MYFQKLQPDDVDGYAVEAFRAALDAFTPGLTDPAHQDAGDASYQDYRDGIAFLQGMLGEIFSLGREYSCVESQLAFEALKQKVKYTEMQLASRTGGKRTWKGSLFAVSLLLLAAGKCDALGIDQDPAYWAQMIADFTKNLSLTSFINLATKTPPLSGGETVYKTYRLTTLRGAAERGFLEFFQDALPLISGSESMPSPELLTKLYLKILSITEDSSILMDHDRETLRATQLAAEELLRSYSREAAEQFHQDLFRKSILPKGALGMLVFVLLAHRLS